MKRAAPDGGYVGGVKRQYRRNVYATFSRMCAGKTSDKTVLLMPSIEGDEITVARQNGFRDNNMYVVDDNPGIAATISKRNPNLAACFGTTTDKAALRIAQSGRKIDFANLDYTSCMHRDLLGEIMWFAGSGALALRSRVAVTIQRGREGTSDFKWIREASTNSPNKDIPVGGLLSDVGRITAIVAALEWAGSLGYIVRSEIYRSTAGSLTMAWTCVELHALGCECRQCAARPIAVVPIGLRIKGGALLMIREGKRRSDLARIAEAVVDMGAAEATAYVAAYRPPTVTIFH